MRWRLRAEVRGKKVVVSSSHPLATLSGIRVFEKGGNFMDAALAVSSTLCVVQNNLCGLGGDMFALVGNLGGRIRSLNASGRAGKLCTPEFFRNKGMNEIPKRGPLSAVTVPGLVDGWNQLLKNYCSFELADLLSYAVEAAETGFPVTINYSASVSASQRTLGEYENWRKIFTPDGGAPAAGSLFRQKDLASSLRSIAEEGAESFYRGSLCARMVKGIDKLGGVLTEEDFAHHTSNWEEPLKTDYRGLTVYETPPNSQAATVLLWLNMLENADVGSMGFGTPECLKMFYKTCAAAYSERAKWIGDPRSVHLPRDFLSKEYARGLLDESEPAPITSKKEPGSDTTYFAVADCEGNFASVIQSNYMGFGSGVVPEGTGIVLHNRGCYFTLDASSHNQIAPGKRTFHTLCASAASRDGEPALVIGSMGGDIQPQIHVQLMTNVVDFNMDLQSAIDAPRWAAQATIYDKELHYMVEEELAEAARRAVSPKVEVLSRLSSTTGHAQGVLFERNGTLVGAADGRGDGLALGY
ncbi:MAG: gamma-glutamyltransferase family protein [Thermoprotei archaeon]